MFQIASGIKIPFPEKIKEEYQIINHCIQLNLSFEKIRPLLYDFLEQLEEPLFFVLQLPLSPQEEAKLRKRDTDPLHQMVSYLDGQTREEIRDILNQYGDLLLNDGISQFAIASHKTKEEIFIRTYKLINIYCYHPEKFNDLLEKYGLNQTDNLFTIWDTFSNETPGKAYLVTMNGINVYDVYNELVNIGMYDAKIIDD